MAVYTEAIQKLYVAYFNRPADYEGLAFWEKVLTANGGNLAFVSSTFAKSPEYQTQVAGKSYFQIVNQIYNNLFNRDADVTGLEFWAARLREGTFTVDQIVKIIADSASDTDAKDKTTYANKVAAATAFTAELNTASEIIGYTGDKANSAAKVWLSTVGDTASLNNAIAPANLQATVNSVTNEGLSQSGQTYNLVKTLDNLTGTSGNDTFVAAVSSDTEIATLSALDTLNGGTGTDTLRILTDGTGTMDLPNMTSIEVIEAQSSKALTIDTTSANGVTSLNVVRANGDIDATAAKSTDINVSLRDTTDLTAVKTTGGKNVSVKLTDAESTTDIIDATGAVVVEKTGAAAVNSATQSLGDITISGGTTVNVTTNVGSISGLTAGAGLSTYAQGNIDITAKAATTTINVKQAAAADGEDGAVAKTGVAEVVSVKFTSLTAGSSFTVGGLTFKADKALTANQVAQAFANLSATALKPTNTTPTTATGDTNGSGVVANGEFTGSLIAGWSTGAASGDTVTFTASAVGEKVDTVLNPSAGTATVTTQGVNAVTGAAAAAAVTAGEVTITADAALASVTVNGYSAANSEISGTAAALATLNLSNGGAFAVADTAATLGLTLENVDGALTFTDAPSTLNVKSVGDNTIGTLDASETVTLNVSGTGTLSAVANTLTSLETIVVTETAGLDLGNTVTQGAVKSVNTTGTTGTVTVKVDGTKATYTGGAGVDNLTVTAATAATVLTKAINLGAGNDRLDLTGMDAAAVSGMAAANVFQGGDGTDTIALSAAAANTASNGATFEARINGFEKLEVGAVGANTLVDLDNMDDINYVISKGSGAFSYKLDKMLAGATVELTAAHTNGIEVALKDATGEADAVNLIAKASTGVNIGTVTVADVETINVTAADTTAGSGVSTNTLTVNAAAAATINVTGAGNLNLILGTDSDVVTLVDASTATGVLNLNLSAHVGEAVTVKGGAAADVLRATVGVDAKADVLIGGAGNDTLYAGSNGATLTGGAGNDLFVLAGAGTNSANAYSVITDFSAGDLLQLGYLTNATPGVATTVTSFEKLTASLSGSTAVFTDFVEEALKQADAGDAVWFVFQNNSYVVIDSGAESGETFGEGTDLIIQLAGVDLNNASFNATFGTVALV